jgi:hypothetical protein
MTPRDRQQVFAVVRFDPEMGEPENQVTVKEIVVSQEIADAEVARLNRLNADKGCVYFSQITRYFPDGSSAGSQHKDESRPAV